MDTPFEGNLLPEGATGGQIKFRSDGSQHVTIRTDGAHLSYDRLGDATSNVHATLHDVLPGRPEPLIVPGPDLGFGG